MMTGMDWEADIRVELEDAETSRKPGNEGRARVSARRAAGEALSNYRRIVLGRDQPTLSAVTMLRWFRDYQGSSPALRLAAERLTAHVTKDHDLPHEQDPIQDARSIVAFVQDAIANC